MQQSRDELFSKLVEKTRAVGRQLTFKEVEEDENMPRANNYAFYFGSFTEAAKEAWRNVRGGDVVVKKDFESRGVIEMSKRFSKMLSPEREEIVISEFVDMFIAADGQMPSQRMIKKNQYISEEEVNILRRAGRIRECDIRRKAEEKTGRKFMSADERRKEKARKDREERLALIAKMEEEEKVRTEAAVELVKEATEVETPAEIEETAEVAAEIAKDLETTEEVKEVKRTKVNDEELKKVVREFCLEKLRWPTDKEIHEFRAQKVAGWVSSAEMYRKFGSKKDWAKIFFPEGLPEGFSEQLRGGARSKKKTSETASKRQRSAKAPVEVVPEVIDSAVAQSEDAVSAFDFKDAVIEVALDRMKISIPVVLTIPKGVAISGTVQLTLVEN